MLYLITLLIASDWDPCAELLKIEKICLQKSKALQATNPATYKKQMLQFIGTYQPQAKDRRFEYFFCYEKFVRRAHPVKSMIGQDVSNQIKLKKHLLSLYQQINSTFTPTKKNPGHVVYYQQTKYKKEPVYLKYALSDLSNLIAGYPRNDGLCGVCKRIQKGEYETAMNQKKALRS